MRNFLILTIFSFLSIILLQFCSGEPKDSCCISKELIPLSEGNFWTYDNYYFRKTGKDTIYYADSITLHLGKRIKLNNEDWYQWGLKYFDFANVCSNKKNGLYNITDDSLHNFQINKALLFFKYPTKLGDEWYNEFDEGILQTVNLEEVITVPAGTFKCIHYRRKDLGKYPNSGFFIAPGIGIIKFEITIGSHKSNPSPDVTWNLFKLKRYKIK
ncbi:MAG: hypothetical protein A2X61_13850 [Ignavibacteria bacterium GWB2_35_12]|nr:MAG: hypothetical protein A2X63_03990 [Ignavibacteria bacterium GWA2_35_8]OGU41194.1 MAG: hypothetical protein A2X61_13850 [Ignavibacteria bacterium GWB2_35_12]OGU86799.1 MAG: hypothetical protein A2220_09020 [Ignavibacteria bacterium RIFOXYA2_FULL_35_10]OGV23117.1 MAG: hypothetical protein A2475_17180 [Ignavibacteria bacterium RIFOXYC2_FULL_35_21]